ncbi:MAG: winged helix-turn-helix transcriptional regulator [Christensenellaceae bacterium]|nr:winged helix-turn-helix transcriptional regulator [Christensenellaceae bacterium]
MPKSWTTDSALVDSVAKNLCEAVVLLPKQLLHVDELTRSFGMPFSHIQILVMLASGDITIGDISTTLGIAKPNITPLLDSLSERGLVERVRGTGDKRIVNVHLTEAGQEMLSKLQAAIAEQVTGWEKRCNRSDIKQINNALAFLVQIADRRN